MKTLSSLDVHADDYMFAPLDECRVIPKGEREVDSLGFIRVYESVMGGTRVRRYVHYDAESVVACFLVTIKEGCMPVISLTRVRNDKKRQGYGTLLYMDIRSHFPDVQFLHTSPASQAFAKSVTKIQ